ncbi:MAG: hypothetical protein K2Y71_30265 [Xanthobacteraceae bacterium]|nr:hypothetical protein [Xanthobacteraceae bacterium]
MHEFIAALRQLQRPLVSLAAAILIVQTLVAGLASGTTAARIATFGMNAVICHGTGEDGRGGSTPAGAAATHACCTFCTNAGPVALAAGAVVLDHLRPAYRMTRADHPAAVHLTGRAIRAGPSQAPPTGA